MKDAAVSTHCSLIKDAPNWNPTITTAAYEGQLPAAASWPPVMLLLFTALLSHAEKRKESTVKQRTQMSHHLTTHRWQITLISATLCWEMWCTDNSSCVSGDWKILQHKIIWQFKEKPKVSTLYNKCGDYCVYVLITVQLTEVKKS